MTLSVVIPVLNEEKNIATVLRDLVVQTRRPDEVIIVDGGSHDNTLAIVRSFEGFCKIVLSDRKSPGYQRTLGGNAACSDLILFLDADTRFENQFIERIVELMENNNIGLGTFRYIPRTKNLLLKIFFALCNSVFFLLQCNFPLGGGHGIVVMRDVWVASQGFNDYAVYEDIDFLKRAAACGRFAVLPLTLYVSDRRFKKYGVIRQILLNIRIGFVYTFFGIKAVQGIRYKFVTRDE